MQAPNVHRSTAHSNVESYEMSFSLQDTALCEADGADDMIQSVSVLSTGTLYNIRRIVKSNSRAWMRCQCQVFLSLPRVDRRCGYEDQVAWNIAQWQFRASYDGA
jgi:hypothetical protein